MIVLMALLQIPTENVYLILMKLLIMTVYLDTITIIVYVSSVTLHA